jgi:uncharacterized protein (TIGR03643 family)
MRSPVCLAAKVGKGLGKCQILQRAVSSSTSFNTKAKGSVVSLSPAEKDRIIQMAWEDRTTFDAIQSQFGLTPGQVIKLMRAELKPSSFRLWRARTTGRKTKHGELRSFKVGRFRCPDQKNSA